MLYKILLIKHLRISDIYRIFILGMKIKQTIFLGIIFGFSFICLSPITVNAASCAGVDTSVISCDDESSTGVCKDGIDPYEGVKPTTDDEKASYADTYGHNYGECDKDGTMPDTEISSTGLWGILILAINILSAAVGVAAVGGIIYGSILYASSGGNPENTKKARKIIFNTVLGLIMFALMFAFLNFLIPGGIFT